MNKKQIGLFLLGLVAVAMAGTWLISAQPKADPGTLEFQKLNLYSRVPEAHFVYHTPSQLKGNFSMACTPLDMTGKPAGAGRKYWVGDLPSGFVFPVTIDLPTNAPWKLQIVTSTPTKGFGVVNRINNVLRTRQLEAWHLNERYVATVYSGPITNPVPSARLVLPKR